MDPASIASLVGAIVKVSWVLTEFTQTCLEAKSDLLAVAKELSDLEKVLKSLEVSVQDKNIPQTLQAGIASTLSNMASVVDQVDKLVKSNSGRMGAVKWTLGGKTRAAELRSQLGAYRESLALTLDMMALSLSKSVKSDTSVIRTDVTEIKSTTTQIPQLIEEGFRRVQVPQYPPQSLIVSQGGYATTSNAMIRNITLADEFLMEANPEDIRAMFCQSCKTGIPYLSDLIICLDCDARLCTRGCHTKHKFQHTHRVRLQLSQLLKSRALDFPSKACMHCLSRVKARWECEKPDCSYVLCLECSESRLHRKKFFADHEKEFPSHRTYSAILSPFWFVTPSRKEKSCVCYKPGQKTLLHCSRCHSALQDQSQIHGCLNCHQTFSFAQWLCAPCFSSADPLHLTHRSSPTHNFQRQILRYGPEIPDSQTEDKLYHHCQTCNSWLKYGDQYTQNPSHLLTFNYGPKAYELVTNRMYQSCDPDMVVQLSGPNLPGPTHEYWRCVLCFQSKLAYDKESAMCFAGGCITVHYCAACTVAKRTPHRHRLDMVMVRKSVGGGTRMIADCVKCGKVQYSSAMQGLYCASCEAFAVCISCLNDTRRSTNLNELVSVLKHVNLKNGWQCASRWSMITR